jgi:hypothetical protein
LSDNLGITQFFWKDEDERANMRILVAITFVLWMVTILLFVQRATPTEELEVIYLVLHVLILGSAIIAFIAVHRFIQEKRHATEEPTSPCTIVSLVGEKWGRPSK